MSTLLTIHDAVDLAANGLTLIVLAPEEKAESEGSSDEGYDSEEEDGI